MPSKLVPRYLQHFHSSSLKTGNNSPLTGERINCGKFRRWSSTQEWKGRNYGNTYWPEWKKKPNSKGCISYGPLKQHLRKGNIIRERTEAVPVVRAGETGGSDRVPCLDCAGGCLSVWVVSTQPWILQWMLMCVSSISINLIFNFGGGGERHWLKLVPVCFCHLSTRVLNHTTTQLIVLWEWKGTMQFRLKRGLNSNTNSQR